MIGFSTIRPAPLWKRASIKTLFASLSTKGWINCSRLILKPYLINNAVISNNLVVRWIIVKYPRFATNFLAAKIISSNMTSVPWRAGINNLFFSFNFAPSILKNGGLQTIKSYLTLALVLTY
ncbi:hypothetical protein [Spiroplasma sp. Moj]|uniref:hypothetical protein n=1 Tax=Spiroplasma sp. Moj TaxID=1922342 RepID=UPI0039F0F3FE